MNYLSVCSGIEAATVAWHHMGWKPVGFSEIEKFPSQVLAHHYPTVTNFGDMTKYKEWNLNDSIGLLVGGTPCQSFSVAGLRKGLDDPRGNLALTYIGILDKFRPKWCVWENVPGVLSSGGGRDFGSFLGALGEIGYGWAYRVLDAQYFGVAQRRKRVFVIGYLGDWKPPAEILFESESLSGNTEKGRKARQEVAGESVPSVANCIQTTCNDYSRADGFNMIAVGAFGKNIADTVTAKFAKGAELLQQGAQNGGNCVLQPTVAAYSIREDAKANNFSATPLKVTPALQALRPSVQSHHAQTFIAGDYAVRRLTPIECERLQGFLDNYTNIKENCPDGPRYKALGNSMAVPVMRWIGERINQYEQRGVEKHLRG